MEKEIESERKKIKRKYLIHDIIIYGSLVIILIWALLKAFGIINSPTFIEMIPVITGIICALAVLLKFGSTQGDIQTNITWLKACFSKMDQRQKNVASSLIRLETDFEYTQKEYTQKDMDKLDKRLGKIENKISRC
jgi:hypothetical protein